jgi:hypothetical protein
MVNEIPILEIKYGSGEDIAVHRVIGKSANESYKKIIKGLLVKNSDADILNHFLDEDYKIDEMSQEEKTLLIAAMFHVDRWIKSQDMLGEYHFLYGEQTSLSNISTYLGRSYEKDIMERKGSRAQRIYKLSKEKIPLVAEQFEKYLLTDIK